MNHSGSFFNTFVQPKLATENAIGHLIFGRVKCRRRRPLSGRNETRLKGKLRLLKQENSFARRWSTFERASMERDHHSRRLQLDFPKPGGRGWTFRHRKKAQLLRLLANTLSGISKRATAANRRNPPQNVQRRVLRY
jgi:hypothetical protein